MKNELSQHIGKVTISKRLRDTPAIISGQMSSSMRIMMQMMEQGQGHAPNSQQLEQIARDQTLELNAGHPLIVNLNKLRKTNDKKLASLVARQMLDNVLAQSGIPYDVREGTERQYDVLEKYVELLTRDEVPALEQNN